MSDLRLPDINRVQIAGRLGHAPELRHSSDGTPVCEFSVAISKRWKQKDGTTKEKTIWMRVEAWRAQAQYLADTLRKGAAVYVEGELTQTEGKDSKPHTRIRANRVQPLEWGEKSETPHARTAPHADTREATGDEDFAF